MVLYMTHYSLSAIVHCAGKKIDDSSSSSEAWYLAHSFSVKNDEKQSLIFIAVLLVAHCAIVPHKGFLKPHL